MCDNVWIVGYPESAGINRHVVGDEREVARTQLTELVAEFPENTLFGSELAKLSVPSAGVHE
jgi:hypothetical protein